MLRTHFPHSAGGSVARWSRMAAALVLVAATSCGDSDADPMAGECTVTAVAIEGLPDPLVAFEETSLTANITQSNCSDLEVAWSGSDNLRIGSDGTVSAEVLGGPFEVTATVEGTEGTAEVLVVSPTAVTDDRWALAWMNQSLADSYTVGNGYSGSTGGSILSNRTGPGAYSVTFAGLAADEGQRHAVAVSSYGGSFPSRCKVLSFGNQGEHLEVVVRCFDLSGTPIDSLFDILVAPAGSTDGRHAFAVTPDGDGGPVAAALAHNSEGGAVHLEHSGTGHYEVTFAGLSREAVALAGKEIFHVTSVGDGADWCKIGGWEPMDTVNLRLTVYCFTPSGSDADARFSVLMLEEQRSGGHRLGYVWADEPTPGAVYTPDLDFNYNSSGATNTVERSSLGNYEVGWTGLDRPSGTAVETNLVTAIGEDAAFCKVGSWGDDETDIDCYAPNGTRVDSELSAIWIE